jgi:hypothetical protein
LRLAGRVPDRKTTIRILVPFFGARPDHQTIRLFFAHGLQSVGSSSETGLIAVHATMIPQNKTSSKTSTPKSANPRPPKTSKILPEGRKIFRKLSEHLRLNNWHKHLLLRGRYDALIFNFHPEDRAEFLYRLGSCYPDPIYWQLVSTAWQSLEVIHPSRKLWLEILYDLRRGGREHLMEPEEHAVYNSLPTRVRIWRGCGELKAARGMSWTLDREKAVWFASYACGTRRSYATFGREGTQPILVEGTVHKHDVLAFFNGRKESEIVVDPANVKIVSKQPCEIHSSFAEQMEDRARLLQES